MLVIVGFPPEQLKYARASPLVHPLCAGLTIGTQLVFKANHDPNEQHQSQPTADVKRHAIDHLLAVV